MSPRLSSRPMRSRLAGHDMMGGPAAAAERLAAEAAPMGLRSAAATKSACADSRVRIGQSCG
jgi:hypothetical protein